MAVDIDAARKFALKVWKYKEGELVSVMIHLGDRLGIYRVLARGKHLTAEELASETDLDHRWLDEWLLGQAAAGVVDRTPDGRYAMSPEAALVLADEESLLFASGGFAGGVAPEIVERIEGAMRTGAGFTYGDMDERTARQLDRMNGPWLRHFLVPMVVPLLGDLKERMERGALVLDVGCGGGVALQALADAYPRGHYRGIDPSPHAVARAADRLGSYPQVIVEQRGGEDLDEEAAYDLVLTLDTLHDVPRPDVVAGNVRRAVKADGLWLVKDVRCGPTYESNSRNPLLAMMYGLSLTACLPSGTSEPGGAGLGTLGLPPDRLRGLADAAGFSTLVVHDLDDPVHLYYEIRP